MAKIGLFALLSCICYAYVAEGLSPGVYYIKSATSGLCGDTEAYIAFKNTTCGVKAGPILRSGESSMGWKQWTISVTDSFADGSIRAKISNYYKNGKVKCLGSIAIGNTAAGVCSGSSAEKLSLRRNGSAWRLIPVGSSGAYQITAEGRGSNCARFLGTDCTTVRLFDKNDGSGAQQWILKPIKVAPTPSPTSSPPPSPTPVASPPPPAPVVAPSKPGGINTVYVDEKMWYVTWVDNAIGKSNEGANEETYTLKCTYAGQKCDGPAVGTLVTGIKRGVQQGSVPDLPEASSLNCFVIAVNGAGSTCSDPIPVLTLGGGCGEISDCLQYDSNCNCKTCKTIPRCLQYDKKSCKCISCDISHCVSVNSDDCTCRECEKASYPSYLLDNGICRAYAPFAFAYEGFLVCEDDTYNACAPITLEGVPGFPVADVIYAYDKYYLPSRAGIVITCPTFDLAAKKFTDCNFISNPAFGTFASSIFDGKNFIFSTQSGWITVCRDAALQDCFKVDKPGFTAAAIAYSGSEYVIAGTESASVDNFLYVCSDGLLDDCIKTKVPGAYSYGIATDGNRWYYTDPAQSRVYGCDSNFDCEVWTTADPIFNPFGIHYFDNKVLVGSGINSQATLCDVSVDPTRPVCAKPAGLSTYTVIGSQVTFLP